MSTNPPALQVVRFGVFEVDLRTGELRKDGVKVRLQEKPFQMLAALLERPGELVTREELQQRLWPNGTFVDFEHGLGTAIKKIRQALGDSADTPLFVETLPRRGFRFIAPLDGVNGQHAAAAPPALAEREIEIGETVPLSATRSWRWLRFLLAGAALAAGVVTFLLRPQVPAPELIRTVQITNDHRVKFDILVTDGTRVYFTELVDGHRTPVAVSVNGGETVPILSPLPDTEILDISRSGGELLVLGGDVTPGPDRPLWVLPTLGGTPRRVGDLIVGEATWSPDEDKIAYIKGQDLYVARNDGTESRKLASLPGILYLVRWSPDGTRLNFTVEEQRPPSHSLWEVSADGTNLHRRFPGWDSPRENCCGHWTPDGTYFVFRAYRNGSEGIWAVREKGSLFERWNPEPVQVISGPLGMLTAGGHRIFYLSQSATPMLSRHARSGGWMPFLSGISAEWVEFAREGQGVSYISFPDRQLFTSALDGSRRLQLTSPPLRAASPRWSPDGKKIAFMGKASRKYWRIYVVSTDGGTPQPLLGDGGALEEADPDWSPDGDSLVFYRRDAPGKNASLPTSALHVLDLRTNRTTSLPGSADRYYPGWAPDGRYISATAGPYGEFTKIVLFDLQTRRWLELAKGGDLHHPIWSHDSKYVYFIDWSVPGYYRVRIRDRKVERILDLSEPTAGVAAGARGGWVGLAPDDTPLLLRTLPDEIMAIDWNAR